jgi:hypothetical protein
MVLRYTCKYYAEVSSSTIIPHTAMNILYSISDVLLSSYSNNKLTVKLKQSGQVHYIYIEVVT